MTATRLTLAALLLLIAAQAASLAMPYTCETDTDCEREEALRCWIFCQR